MKKLSTKRATVNAYQGLIVVFLALISWAFAMAGQYVFISPWNLLFFFSRFFFDIDIIVFGIVFILYFKFIHYFEPLTVAIIAAISLGVFDLIAGTTFNTGGWFFNFLDWIISSFIATIMIFVMSIRFKEKNEGKNKI